MDKFEILVSLINTPYFYGFFLRGRVWGGGGGLSGETLVYFEKT